jgi:hypothetical protein
VVLPIQNEVTLSEGNYAVFAYQDPSNPEAWQGRFVSPDGAETFVPAKYVEMRGQIEEPLAIVIDLRICLCFFEC